MNMRSQITTHVLDTSRGTPAAGVRVMLEIRESDNRWRSIAAASTDGDGRLATWLPEGMTILAGVYRLTFDTGRYFRSSGRECFYPTITVIFEINDTNAHYHVPLLVSPFGYSTYRGS